jgi:hypothetical protein
MPDTALPLTKKNYFFVPAPLTLQQLNAILAGVESEDDVHPVDRKYPTNSWVTHVYSATVENPPSDGYAVLFDISPEDDDGTHPVQVVAVTGADEEKKADNAALQVGRGNDLIGYEDFAGQRGVIFRTKAAPPAAVTAPASLSWDNAERRAWSTKLLSLIQTDRARLEAGNPDSFIPGYNGLAPDAIKLKFWAELLIAMAKFESGWDSKNVFREPPPLGVNSIGLLQLSKQDENGYAVRPPIAAENELKDPILNLEWGVTIFATLLARDRVVASGAGNASRGGADYWSVLRTGHKIDLIKAITRQNVGL